MIIVAGLTPAWQQIVSLQTLRIGEVNRTADVHGTASGKVLNVAIGLAHLGAAAEVVTLLGGPSGDAIRRELAVWGMKLFGVPTRGPTRVCTTILDKDTDTATELVQEAAPLGDDELKAFRKAFRQAARQATLVVLTGSLPEGTPATFFRELLEETTAPAILDVRGAELSAALDAKPLLVKPNRHELGQTVGSRLDDEGSLCKAMQTIHDRGARWVVVTDGPHPVHVLSDGLREKITPPHMTPVNPIGSGDCMAAGMAWSLDAGGDVPGAIRLGLAAAAENAAAVLPARLDPQSVRRRAAKIKHIRT